MSAPFAILTMGRSGYATSLTAQGKALPPGTYMLLAVPVADYVVDGALANHDSLKDQPDEKTQ